MNRYKWMAILCLAIAGVCFSCYEDKGNYDYNWLNAVKLRAGIRDTITVQQGKLLKITPEPVVTVNGDTIDINPDDYTFTWEAVVEYDKRELLSTERDFNEVILLPIGKHYQVNYTVTEKASGVSWMDRFYLYVVQQYTDGLIFMTEDDNKQVELEIYANDTEGNKVHETGILARSGFPYRGGGAQFISSTRVRERRLFLSTGEGTGWLSLPDFSWEDTQMARMLMIMQEPVSYTFCNIDQFISTIAFGFTKDGEVHPYNVNDVIYTDVAHANLKKFKASPWLGGHTNNAIFYDTDRGRFMLYAAGLYGWQFPGSQCADVSEEAAFDGSTLLFMSRVNNNETVAIIKDKNGDYRRCILTIGGGYYNPEVLAESYLLTSSMSMLETAETKAIDWVYKNVYFTSGGKLYCYRMGSGIDACREVNLVIGGNNTTLSDVVSVIVVPNSVADVINHYVYVTTYNSQNGGTVYVTQPQSTEPLNLDVNETIKTEGRVKSLSRWSN